MLDVTEYQICCAIKDFADLYHIPIIHLCNEGKRSAHTGHRLKRIGLCVGASDYFFMQGNEDYKGLWLEVKTIKGKPTKLQLTFLELVRTHGYAGLVAYGLEDALNAIRAFYRLS